ncbi:sel1 repeat family protein [Thiothrix subterranea]|uniref:tetratricopeptide repeat protein n=1 Tax=Thiothrix subterranea TaxID=2735563 RepID=UPI00192B4F7E|nr:tetratricopeptide repeat protein [Thiothrix subterranea]QQZ28752.1 sel1 repeat family protein [Thiothrix subterranea]
MKVLFTMMIALMLYACSDDGLIVRDYKFDSQDINQVKTAAAQGDAGAMFELGMGYMGTGMVEEDYKQGMSWLTKSAEKGDVLAQSTLGNLYLSDKIPVKGAQNHVQDFSKARYWFEKGAEKNDGMSQLGLATIYSKGLGVAKDDKIASEWLRKAKANRDNVTISSDLMYTSGK